MTSEATKKRPSLKPPTSDNKSHTLYLVLVVTVINSPNYKSTVNESGFSNM